MLNTYIKNLKNTIILAFKNVFSEEVNASEIILEQPPNPELGEFAVACFPFAKKFRKSPAHIAKDVAEKFTENDIIKEFKAQGPYLNAKIDKSAFCRIICESILQEKEQFGSSTYGLNKRVMVEYSSPNTNKPLHIGHVRNNLIGMALANIFQFCGFEVIKANLINDRGIHICKSMLAYKKWGENADPVTKNKKGDHFVGEFYVLFENAIKEEKKEYALKNGIDTSIWSKENVKKIKEEIKKTKDKEAKRELKKSLQELVKKEEVFEKEFLANSKYYKEAMELLRKWEQNDPETRELWKKMNNWVLEGFNETYARLGCSFDKVYLESDTYKLGKEFAKKGLEKEIFFKKEDGSIWVSGEKLQQFSPEEFKGFPLKDKLLLRPDGTSVYMTQDIGTAVLKAEDTNLTESIYVVASEQILHFKILFTILKMLDFPWANGCHHVSYGMVTLPHGMGKIKSREGTAVDADDLIFEMQNRVREKMNSSELRVAADDIEKTSMDIALAALKIFILQVSLEKDIQFDPNSTISFTGDTGPAIQYSYARIQNIFKKAEKKNIQGYENVKKLFKNEKSSDFIHYELFEAEEFELVRTLFEFPHIIQATCKTYSTSLLVNYLLSLTKSYASIYAKYHVLGAEDENVRNVRLVLAKVIAQVIKNGMNLLGVVVPDNM